MVQDREFPLILRVLVVERNFLLDPCNLSIWEGQSIERDVLQSVRFSWRIRGFLLSLFPSTSNSPQSEWRSSIGPTPHREGHDSLTSLGSSLWTYWVFSLTPVWYQPGVILGVVHYGTVCEMYRLEEIMSLLRYTIIVGLKRLLF